MNPIVLKLKGIKCPLVANKKIETENKISSMNTK
jgi:hypothetical protein